MKHSSSKLLKASIIVVLLVLIGWRLGYKSPPKKITFWTHQWSTEKKGFTTRESWSRDATQPPSVREVVMDAKARLKYRSETFSTDRVATVRIDRWRPWTMDRALSRIAEAAVETLEMLRMRGPARSIKKRSDQFHWRKNAPTIIRGPSRDMLLRAGDNVSIVFP